SYRAGISFLLARSPVTPNITMTQGPATRGIRRSRGSRSGLTGSVSAAITPGFAGAGPGIPAFGSSMMGTSCSSCVLRLEAELVLDALEHLVPRHRELRDALVLEDLDHVVVADAERLQGGEQRPRLLVGAVDRVAPQDAVVGGGAHRRLGRSEERRVGKEC